MYRNWPLMEDYEEFEDMEDLENYEDFEEFEDMEDLEDMEDMEDFENYEDFEDFEDGEGDLFLGNIVGRMAKVAKRLPWQKILRTGVSAISGMGESDPEREALWEMAYLAELAADTESDYEADHFIGALAGLAGQILPSLLGGSDMEDLEDMEDFEDFEDGEGDQFFPALLPLAKMVLPHALPLLKRGIQRVGRALREADPSKQSVKVLPIVAAKTVASLAKQAKAGKPLTPKRVNATIAAQTKKTLASPKQVAKAITQNRKAAQRAVQQTRKSVQSTKKAVRQQRLMRAN